MKNLVKKLQQEEAVERLKLLRVSSNVIKDFKNGTLYYSERQNSVFDGILYWLKKEQEFVDIVKEFESKYDAIVYHAQLTHTEFGPLLSLLYVDKTQDEWTKDKEDIKNGQTIAYVVNTRYDEKEFGYIGVAPRNGGISRTW